MNIDKLFEINEFDTNSLYEALQYRGFLLDYKPTGVYLSDNSYLKENLMTKEFIRKTDDKEYLLSILRDSGAGTIDENLRIVFNKSFSREKFYSTLFGEIGIGGESGHEKYREKWVFFKGDTSYKIPVATLDPFIARLVKAFSSVGIATSSSCNGLGEDKVMHVSFTGPLFFGWAKNVFLLISGRCLIKGDWIFNNQNLIISMKPGTSIENLYREVHSVAGTIYDNRIILRELKREFCGNYSGSKKDVATIMKSMNSFFKIKRITFK